MVAVPLFGDLPAVCLDGNRPRPGRKAELYCPVCSRARCLFRPSMTPEAYRRWQLREEESRNAPLEVENVPVFILETLVGNKSTVEQLAALVGLSRSQVWVYLARLRDRGLVVSHGTGRGRELVWRLKGMDVLVEPQWIQELFFGDFEIVEPVLEPLPVAWTVGSPFDEVLIGEPVWGYLV